MDWRRHLTGRPALVAAGVGALLTFLVTVGKMVEPRVLLMRYLLNAAVFYALGAAAAAMWERLTASLEESGPAEPVAPPVEPLGTPEVPEAAEEGPGEVPQETPPEEGAGEAETAAAQPAAARKTSHSDFEIRDEYIVIKDRKIPNDPKLMAQAIKTKISE